MKKMAMAIVLAGVVVLSGLMASQNIQDESFQLVNELPQVDNYPHNATWSSFGNATNLITGTENQLQVANTGDPEAYFISERFNKSGNIEIERLIVDMRDFGESQTVDMYLQYYRDEMLISSQNVTIESGTRSYEINAPNTEYDAYSFSLFYNSVNSNENPEIYDLNVDYTLKEVLTDGFPIDLSDFIFLISLLFGTIIALVGVASGVNS